MAAEGGEAEGKVAAAVAGLCLKLREKCGEMKPRVMRGKSSPGAGMAGTAFAVFLDGLVARIVQGDLTLPSRW